MGKLLHQDVGESCTFPAAMTLPAKQSFRPCNRQNTEKMQLRFVDQQHGVRGRKMSLPPPLMGLGVLKVERLKNNTM